VPSTARGTAPETGASSIFTPALASRSPTRRVVAGSIVLMSMHTSPDRAPSSTPLGPRYAVSTSGEFGSIVISTPTRRARSAAELAAVAPRWTAPSTASARTSYASTRWPPFTRLVSIGSPMFPIPTKPMVVIETPRAGEPASPR
jgi:hypothetical protein